LTNYRAVRDNLKENLLKQKKQKRRSTKPHDTSTPKSFHSLLQNLDNFETNNLNSQSAQGILMGNSLNISEIFPCDEQSINLESVLQSQGDFNQMIFESAMKS